ncbi:restriction endonuclease subunit S [Streptomyces sp. NPDC092307]|uniref:restriction endonuclease subunit S n=1 Tax=Streptomyces sp. NPDC092307 TaxID=3366013 RepID=UPI00380387F9
MRADIRWVQVGELGEVRMGKQLSPASRVAIGQFPYLRVANVFDGLIDYADVNTMGFTPAERKTYSLRSGDILINEGQSLELVGRSALYDGPEGGYCFQNTLIRFRPEVEVVPEYAQAVFSRWLATGVFAAIAKKTTSIAHLGGDRFASLRFPLVSLSEQHQIVEALGTVSTMERSIESSISKAQTLREGVVGEFLGDLEWNRPLGEALSGAIRNGFSPVESHSWTGVQMLGLGCLTRGGFQPRQMKNAPVSVSASHAAILTDGDLLMSRANTRDLVGLVGIYRDVGNPCIYPDLMMRLRAADGVRSEFLEAVLSSPRTRRSVQAFAQGTSESMVKISAATAANLMVPLPGLEIQDRLLSVQHALDGRISGDIKALNKLRKLREGIVDDLFVGQASSLMEPPPGLLGPLPG